MPSTDKTDSYTRETWCASPCLDAYTREYLATLHIIGEIDLVLRRNRYGHNVNYLGTLADYREYHVVARRAT